MSHKCPGNVPTMSQMTSFSEMMQQRWTKWKDDNGTYIVPYYFSKSFPGTEENIHTINSHIDWFNKAGFQILAL